MPYEHIPVMRREVLSYLQPRPGQKFIDCTLGGAGYTLALAEQVGQTGQVIGIDLDPAAIEHARAELQEKNLSNVVLVQDNFKNLKEIVASQGLADSRFDGIVFDLGLSSAQLADTSRGFSFQGERPLEMTFGPANRQSTAAIVSQYPLPELTRIFREYGEERWAYQIAKAIVNARREQTIRTTAELVKIIESVVPFRFRTRLHPATRIFQALRMETNAELDALAAALPQAVELLKPQGRLTIISFHSGEDRIVKRFFKSTSGLQILTKRPDIPTDQETAANPRARSAKLRAAAKI
ncbi:MAG: 16S rRNA (cytosine(1402)-N(4))-methyltransferase RsmH [Patescibacteria group bacterium]